MSLIDNGQVHRGHVYAPDLVFDVRSEPARSTNVSCADRTRAMVPASAPGENGADSSSVSRICSPMRAP